MVFESEKSGKLGEMILKYSSSADKICPTLVSSARARWIRTSFSCLREHAGARARDEVSRERKGDEDECSSNVDYTLLTRRIHIQHSHRSCPHSNRTGTSSDPRYVLVHYTDSQTYNCTFLSGMESAHRFLVLRINNQKTCVFKVLSVMSCADAAREKDSILALSCWGDAE